MKKAIIGVIFLFFCLMVSSNELFKVGTLDPFSDAGADNVVLNNTLYQMSGPMIKVSGIEAGQVNFVRNVILPFSGKKMAVIGSRVVISGSSQVIVMNAETPLSSVLSDPYELQGLCNFITIDGNRMISWSSESISIYDSSDLSDIQFRSSLSAEDLGLDRLRLVSLSSGELFITGSDSLIAVNVTHPENPEVDDTLTAHMITSMAVRNNVLYYCSGNPYAPSAIKVVDISDTKHLTTLNTIDNDVISICVAEDMLYAIGCTSCGFPGFSSYLKSYNLSTPQAPVSVSQTDAGSMLSLKYIEGYFIAGKHKSSMPDSPGGTFYQLGAIANGSFNSYILLEYFQTQKLSGVWDGHVFVNINRNTNFYQNMSDLNNPEPPVYMGSEFDGVLEFRFYENIMIYSKEGKGIYIADMSAFPSIVPLGSSTPEREWTHVEMNDHLIITADAYARYSDNDERKRIFCYDWSDKSNPVEVNSIFEDKFVDMSLKDSILYVSAYGKGISVLDISDLENVTTLKVLHGEENYREYRIYIFDNILVVADEDFLFYDITQPEDPVLISTITREYFPNSVGNMKFNNGYLYIYSDPQVSNAYHAFYVINVNDINNPFWEKGYYESTGDFYFTSDDVLINDENLQSFTIYKTVDEPFYGYLPHIPSDGDGWNCYTVYDNDIETNEYITTAYFDNWGFRDRDFDTFSYHFIKKNSSWYSSGITSLSNQGHCRELFIHETDHGLAEFNLNDTLLNTNFFCIPHYAEHRLNWGGLAIMNPSGEDAGVTLTARTSQGELLGTQYITIQAESRTVGQLSDFFPNLIFRQISRVKVESYTPLTGITMSGKDSSSVLFTQGTFRQPAGNYAIPHLADETDYWDNFLIVENTVDGNQNCVLHLFSQGDEVYTESITVSPYQSYTVNLDDIIDNYQADCGYLELQGNNLIARQSFVNVYDGMAEFMLVQPDSTDIVCHYPWYMMDNRIGDLNFSMNWMGLAVYNHSDSENTVTLSLFGEHEMITQTSRILTAHSNYVGLLTELFEGVSLNDIYRVEISGTEAVSAIQISGENLEHLLFTPSVSKMVVED